MLLTFLSASIPLTKTIAFSPRTGEYTVTSYPMVSKMTSEAVDAQDMRAFAQAVDHYGRRGWCLLKGELDAPLVDESRAGRTVMTADHEWICFDFDKVDCPPTFEGALEAVEKYLPPITHDVDIVIQLSASCFHPHATKLSAHIFMKLTQPVSTDVLRDWLLYLNWTQPALRDEIRLTDSQRALSYPLDTSVSSPAKLIYIAPPRCVGFAPPLSEAVRFYPGDVRALTIPHFTKVDSTVLREYVNKLRDELGLPALQLETRVIGGQEFYTDLGGAGEIVISDIRVSPSGHLRFNVNGGDSMAYYIDLKRPNVIGNFKGEPFMHTNLVAPKLYEKLVAAAPRAQRALASLSESTEVLAFYATNRGSNVYIGTYDRVSDRLRVDKSTTEAAYAWLAQMGAIAKPTLPHYDLIYDVTSDIRYEEGYPVINLFARTEFMKEFSGIARTLDPSECLNVLGQNCPVLGKLMMSVFAGDKDSIRRFLNWVAYIFQTRKKPGTAWLLHGTEGTGKGMLFEHVLQPLFGRDHCVQVMMKDLAGNFNSLLEGKLMVMIDEANMSKTMDPVEVMSRLRNWITEPKIIINQKYRVEESVPNTANFIVASNVRRPLLLSPGDRRWNVAPRQEERFLPTPHEVSVIQQGLELPELAKLLGSLIVNEEWLHNPLENEAKKKLFEATHGMPDAIAMAIRQGDTNFFLAARPTAAQIKVGMGGILPISEYDDLLRGMLDNSLTVAGYNDLYVLFRVVMQDPKAVESQAAFRKMLRRYDFADPAPHYSRRAGRTVYGFKMGPWTAPDDEFKELVEQLSEARRDNVVKFGAKQ